MLIIQRQQEILDILKKEGSVSVQALAKRLFASEPTVRRDLAALEAAGSLRRVYGGAVSTVAADHEIPYAVRAAEAESAKSIMAASASRYLKNGMVIFLDGSSSASHMVRYLREMEDIIVVTSGAKTAIALAESGVRVISTGGQMIARSFTYVGSHAEKCIQSMLADIVFFSCRGLSDDGEMTDISIEENDLRKVMLRRAKTKILLCDSSKFGHRYVYSLGYTGDIDNVISDNDLQIPIATR